MKQSAKALSLKLDDKQLVLLARGMVQSMFDMVVNGKAPHAVAIPAAPLSLASLPAIGTKVDGAIYAGISIEDNKPVALWLLPGDEKMNWNEGIAWAEKQGGVLPSRFDQLVLFKNLKSEFQEAWYWSGEQYDPGPSCAWDQNFSYGNQFNDLKGGTIRVRAVRRSVIQ